MKTTWLQNKNPLIQNNSEMLLPVNVVEHFLQHLEQTGELLQVERGVDGLG